MKSIISIVFLLFLSSCDCFRVATGTVVDARTGKVLSGVTVYNKVKTWSTHKTDSAGYFKVTAIAGGTNCPPLVVVFEKANYKRAEISFTSSDSQTVRLETLPGKD